MHYINEGTRTKQMVLSHESHTNILFLIKRLHFKNILDEEIVVFLYILSTHKD